MRAVEPLQMAVKWMHTVLVCVWYEGGGEVARQISSSPHFPGS